MPRDPSNPGPNPPQSWTEEDLRAAKGEDLKRQADEHGGDPPAVTLEKNIPLKSGCFLLLVLGLLAPVIIAIGSAPFHAEALAEQNYDDTPEEICGRLEEFTLATSHDTSGNMRRCADRVRMQMDAFNLKSDAAARDRIEDFVTASHDRSEALRFYRELRNAAVPIGKAFFEAVEPYLKP